MALYSDELVDEVRNSNDIVDLISQYYQKASTGSTVSIKMPMSFSQKQITKKERN